MRVNFKTLDEKDLFKIFLQTDCVDFGFIPKWDRKLFLRFLMRNKFLVPFSENAPKWNCRCLRKFSYTTTMSSIDGLPLADFFEWCADITRHRYWKIWPDFWYTNLTPITICPDNISNPMSYTRIHSDGLILN